MSKLLDAANKFLTPGHNGPCLSIRGKAAKVKFLEATIDAYQRLYPRRFKYLLSEMKKLRECNFQADGSYVSKHGTTFVKFRVPTELWLYLQARIPGWGETEKDIELLLDVWQDLVRAGKRDHRKRSRLVVTKELANAVAR